MASSVDLVRLSVEQVRHAILVAVCVPKPRVPFYTGCVVVVWRHRLWTASLSCSITWTA